MFSLMKNIFGPQGFLPHGHCFYWNEWILYTTVISHIFIAYSYTLIPILLVGFIRANKDIIRDKWIEVLTYQFALFIFLCGQTHLFSLINIWYPIYGSTAIVLTLCMISSQLAGITCLVYYFAGYAHRRWGSREENLVSLNNLAKKLLKEENVTP